MEPLPSAVDTTAGHNQSEVARKVLVLDVGGSNVKLRLSGETDRLKIRTGGGCTPDRLVADIKAQTSGWRYDAATIGFPAPVIEGRIPFEPQNLGEGWVDFNFEQALGCPVRLVNDAAMQAVGCYEGGRMLFLSLGTGLGSALVVDHQVVGLELCELRWDRKESLEQRLGKAGLRRLGRSCWERCVHEAAALLRRAFLPDSVVVGGGSAKHLEHLPDWIRRASNEQALAGGERLWTDPRFVVR